MSSFFPFHFCFIFSPLLFSSLLSSLLSFFPLISPTISIPFCLLLFLWTSPSLQFLLLLQSVSPSFIILRLLFIFAFPFPPFLLSSAVLSSSLLSSISHFPLISSPFPLLFLFSSHFPLLLLFLFSLFLMSSTDFPWPFLLFLLFLQYPLLLPPLTFVCPLLTSFLLSSPLLSSPLLSSPLLSSFLFLSSLLSTYLSPFLISLPHISTVLHLISFPFPSLRLFSPLMRSGKKKTRECQWKGRKRWTEIKERKIKEE